MQLTTVMKNVRLAYELLPPEMASDRANVCLLANGLQESRFTDRYQIVNGGGKGPARGFWQFERGSSVSRAGVYGVFLHQASREHLRKACAYLVIPFDPQSIWEAIEYNDVLAALVARLLMFTDPRALPLIGDEVGAWDFYLRTWRPGKPHPDTWADCYKRAVLAVKEV